MSLVKTLFNQIHPFPGGHLWSNMGQQTMIILVGTILSGGFIVAGTEIIEGIKNAGLGVGQVASDIAYNL